LPNERLSDDKEESVHACEHLVGHAKSIEEMGMAQKPEEKTPPTRTWGKLLGAETARDGKRGCLNDKAADARAQFAMLHRFLGRT
jgi:hypothetical protein